MKSYKKIIILIILFLSVFLIKNKALALTLNPEDYYSYDDYLDGLTPLQLQTTTNSYVIAISKNFNQVIVVEPYYSADVLVSYNSTNLYANFQFKGYNKESSSISDVIYYVSDLSDGSWSVWETKYSSNYTLTSPDNSDYYYVDKSNIYCYTNSGSKVVGNDEFCDTLLPDGITFNDNIILFSSPNNTYLCVTNSDNNYFKFFDTYFIGAYTASGSKAKFDYYKYNGKNFVLQSNIESFQCGRIGLSVSYYSTQDFYINSTMKSGFGNFFDFYYQYKVFPSITNAASSLASGTDTVLILPGEFKKTEDFYFAVLHTEEVDVEETGTSFTKEVVDYSTKLNADSLFFKNVYAGEVEDFWYEISPSEYADLLEKDKQYIFRIQYDYDDETYYNDIYASWGGLTSADIKKNEEEEERYQEQFKKIDEQTEAIKEQTETTKGIWETLKQLLSYINPLSENFFAYKLIDLLIDGLKSLFLPDERIF